MARGIARVVEIYSIAMATAWLLLVLLPSSSRQTSLTVKSQRVARQLLYYTGTEMEFNFVLAVPIKSGQHSVTVGFFLEGNYDLPPYNSQAIYIQPLQMYQDKFFNTPAVGSNNRVHRAAVYRAVEGMLESNGGVAGRACLLRSICEAAAWPVQHDGLFGELLHVLLTPSSTMENGPLHPDYPAAEQLGRRSSSRDFCSKAFPACTSSPLDLISSLTSNWLFPT